MLDETSLPDKEAFYSCLNMENITEVDYRHAKREVKLELLTENDVIDS